MAKKILRNLYVDYKVRGKDHLNRLVGLVDFPLADITDEDVQCEREMLAEAWNVLPLEIEIVRFHF